MNEYTPQQLAAMVGLKGSRFITDLCTQGRFPGAYKDNRKQWHIPQDAALAWIAEREAPVDVLPPEGLAVVPRETAKEFVLAIVAEATKKKSEEVVEVKRQLTELREKKAEEVSELQKQVEELGSQLLGVSERLAELEAEKRKPSWWARLWGKG